MSRRSRSESTFRSVDTLNLKTRTNTHFKFHNQLQKAMSGERLRKQNEGSHCQSAYKIQYLVFFKLDTFQHNKQSSIPSYQKTS